MILRLKKGRNTNVYKFNNKNSSKVKKIFSINDRLGRMLIVFFVVFIILIGRLAWLQIVQGAD